MPIAVASLERRGALLGGVWGVLLAIPAVLVVIGVYRVFNSVMESESAIQAR